MKWFPILTPPPSYRKINYLLTDVLVVMIWMETIALRLNPLKKEEALSSWQRQINVKKTLHNFMMDVFTK